MQVYEVNVLLSKPFTVAILHLFFLLFSNQPSARAVYCIQMIVIVLSWSTNNSRAGFISKGHAKSMAVSDSFIPKLVSTVHVEGLKWLTSDLRELKWKQI